MKAVQIGKFKSELSSILEQVQNNGEEFVIEFGKKHKKIAMLVPYKQENKKRKFGQYKGHYCVPEDFDEENEDINEMFYGSSK